MSSRRTWEQVIIIFFILLHHFPILIFFSQGAYGQVKRAKHKVTGITRAVKIIKKGGLSPEEENELKNEIEILKNLVLKPKKFNLFIYIHF